MKTIYAFPRPSPKVTIQPWGGEKCADDYTGMTLRDWFAGMALQGLCAATSMLPNQPPDLVVEYYKALAPSAYGIADRMLEERDK